MLLDDFKGKLNTSKWAKIIKCSTDTALDRLGFYSGSDFMILAERVGLRMPVVNSIIRTLRSKMKGIQELISNSYMPEEMKERARSVVVDWFKAIEMVE